MQDDISNLTLGFKVRIVFAQCFLESKLRSINFGPICEESRFSFPSHFVFIVKKKKFLNGKMTQKKQFSRHFVAYYD